MSKKIKTAIFITLATLLVCASLCSCKDNARQEGLVSDLRQGVENAGDELRDGVDKANDFLE